MLFRVVEGVLGARRRRRVVASPCMGVKQSPA
jgi:hypothetical protein